MNSNLNFIFRYIYIYTFGRHATITWTPLSCFMFEFFLETNPQMFHTATIWLTLALAILRYIYVCHPDIAKLYCTLPLARRVVKVVITLAVVQTACRALDREYLVVSIGMFSHFRKYSVRPLFLRILTKFRRTLKFSVLC